jgi:hypothetical protein
MGSGTTLVCMCLNILVAIIIRIIDLLIY